MIARAMTSSHSIAATVGSLVARIAHGRLARLPVTVRFWDGSVLSGPPGSPVVIVRQRAIAWLVHEPNQLGLVRAYVSGDLAMEGDMDDILALRVPLRGVRLSVRERALALAVVLRLGGRGIVRAPEPPAIESRPGGRRHSLRRDRETVQHHYDVSNDFYAALLGPSFVYSCAYFDDASDTLEEAQERKLEVICRKLRLAPGERLLDVGCGWGSLVMHAAQHHGVRAVGITISEEQAALARERVQEAGLADRVEIRVADYREIDDGPYDKIASVGMYEHVGHAQLDGYAATLARLVRPGGLVLNHGIARLFTAAAAGPKSLIQRYIFPDGELLPLGEVVSSLTRAGLETRDVESLREHYGLTLRRWLANLPAAGVVSGPERERAWQLYLLGSALAFEDGDISIFQVLTVRSGAPHGLPLARPDLLAESVPAGT
jgi:cyclopropane-fatty-acyl-phospholipid synthase